MRTGYVVLAAALGLAACGGTGVVGSDGGVHPGLDGGQDAGVIEPGLRDAGFSHDAGNDAGEREDAGPHDAGNVDDAGPQDAGAQDDAGNDVDAGQPQDAGQTTGWRGPQATLVQVPGSSEVHIQINGQEFQPVFVSVNPQAIQDPSGWDTLLAEVDLASTQGMPIIDLMLGNRSPAFLDQLAQELGNRQVYLWLRFDSWVPEFASVSPPLLEDTTGDQAPGYRQTYAYGHTETWTSIPYYTSLNADWLAAEQLALSELVDDISQSAIGDRVIGLRPTYMAGGEWFQPPIAFHDNTLDESPPNAFPWSNPDVYALWDYGTAEQSDFASWLTDNGYGPLAFPTPSDRVNPELGHTFVLDGSGNGLNAALYHRFESERVATLQDALAQTIKQLTGGKALVMMNNAYLYSLCYYNGSFHTAVEKLLQSTSIDAVAAPYNYDTQGARKVGNPFIPHGPMDSPALHGKLWIHEDDSRPYWSTDGFRTTTTWAEDRALLLRNAVTSTLHGNALYFFDLPDQGWFGGNPSHASETQSLYAELQQLLPKLDGHLGNDGPVKPEIAIFIDDTSYQLYPEFGMDGASSYGTSNALVLSMVEKIANLGAPVRYYLLDDLGNSNLDVSAFKLVFFINTPRITQTQRAQIQSRLMNSNRMLYFQFVAGLFDENLSPDWSLAASFSPGVGSLSDVESSTSTAITTAAGSGYTLAYSPRGADATSLSALADSAGVHRYADGAVVDGAGSVLMVHGASGTPTVNLAQPQRVVDLLHGSEVCENCTSFPLDFTTPDTQVLDIAPKRRLFRYEFSPGSVGGDITTDELTYCGIADATVLQNCGFSAADYGNAPITPYGQLTLTYTGDCSCTPGVP